TIDVDILGRPIKVTNPITANVDYTVYDDVNHAMRTYVGWDGSKPTQPIQVFRDDQAHGYTEVLTLPASLAVSASGEPDGSETFDASDLLTLSRDYTNISGQVIKSDRYFSFSGLTYSTDSDIGTSGTNYYRTSYGYDH